MLNDNGQISKRTRGAEAAPKTYVEKKGFKRAEAAIYLGVAKITIDRLTQRGLLHPSGRCGTRFIPETISTAFCGKLPSSSSKMKCTKAGDRATPETSLAAKIDC